MPEATMTEVHSYIHFTPVPVDYDRRTLYSIFSKYGKVTKLYISPENEFGKVYLDSSGNTEKAYKGVSKSNKEFSLTYYANSGSTYSSNDNSSVSNESFTASSNRNNIETSVTKNLVDVFGRIVTTLQDDDGNVYVSLHELKQSGFELFEFGSLPARDGSHVYNQQKLIQFESFMKAKASEFMLNSNCNISQNTVDEIIQREKKNFFNIDDNVGTSAIKRKSLDNTNNDFNKSRGSFTPKSNNENINSNKYASMNCNSNERRRNFSNSPSVKNQSFENTYAFIKQEPNNEQSVEMKSTGNTKDIKPLMDIPLLLNKQNQVVNTSIIKEESSDYTKPKQFQESMNTRSNMEGSPELRKPHFVKSIDQETNKLKMKRNLAIEKVCDSAIFQFCEKINDKVFTGFALPEGCGGDFEMLNEVGSNLTYDTEFTPNVGDIVAVDHDDEIARGLILSNTNRQYVCALIDYGTTSTKHQVRKLLQKYKTIPEFSFECEADASIMQKLQEANDTIKMSIKAPCKISLCLESGETYELVGRPIQSCLKDNKLESQTLSKKPEEDVLEKAPSTVPQLQNNTKQLCESNETIFTPRKLVIEELCSRGSFDFIAKTSDTTFICFICPEKFLTELNLLETIYKDTSADKSFKPQVGDLVAANSSEDGVVRGIVLNILNDKYECALIDYGTIQWISDVRVLPDKYTKVPEFVCECKADSKVLQDLENLTKALIQIKSSCTLTITSDSGKEYVVKGVRWNPLKHKATQLQTKSEESIVQKISNESKSVSIKTRQLAINETSSNGIFEFAKRIDENMFLGCAIPATFKKEIDELEQININCVQDVSFSPNPGDLVAALGFDGFSRAIVVDYFKNEFTCAFIDYGIVKKVDEVRDLPDKYKMIPEFAFQCTADPKIIDDLEQFPCLSMVIKAPYTLTLHLENGKQYTVEGYRWNPTKHHLKDFKKVNSCETYKCPPKCSLIDNDKVMIVGVIDNILSVRNKECHSTYKTVCEELSNYKGKPYHYPEVGSLAVCNFNDDNLYRVVINKVDGEKVTLDYIDYGNVDCVAISGLQTISEKLANMKSTLIHIHLKDFTQRKFTEQMLKLLENCSQKREKFCCQKIQGDGNAYDLMGTDGISLTDRLINLQTNVTLPKLPIEIKPVTPQSREKSEPKTPKPITPKPQKIMEPICKLADIVKCDLIPGNVKLLCTYVGNLEEGLISFCKADDETDMILTFVSEKISKALEKDTSTSYIPVHAEVCLAKFDGDWFRAAVIKIETDNKFGVYFVDYGNHCIVNSTDIRKLPTELFTTKAMAMVCRLDGIFKENEKAISDRFMSRLKADIVESEIYSIKISSVQDNIYYITIPSLMKQWKDDGLM